MLVRNAVLPDGRRRDVRIAGERIAAVERDLEPVGGRVVEAAGRRLFPGMIDAHVHLREPGFGHKETWLSGTKSAAAGGVTVVVDQPNTDPPTVDGPGFDRTAAAADAAVVDYGINGGAVPGWDPDSLFDRPAFALGELFLADSTGGMGIDAELFAEALAWAAVEGVPATVHAEDADRFDERARDRDDPDAWSAYRPAEAERAAVEQACAIARECRARTSEELAVHIAHASTPEAIDAAAAAGATVEVTPHHLFLSRPDLPDLGTRGRMNPPLRRESRRRAVFDRVADGSVDMIATDHAPHTAAEKDTDIWSAPSGVPGVETALPLLLAAAREGRLTHERVRELTATGPARVFGLPDRGRIVPGNYADLVLVEAEPQPIRAAELHTACDWTPFEGRSGVFPELTIARGRVAYDRNAEEPFGPPAGQNVRGG